MGTPWLFALANLEMFKGPGGNEMDGMRYVSMLVSAILDGQIPPGGPLPSCRSLAQSLKIARNTVVLAYQDLVEEGFHQ